MENILINKPLNLYLLCNQQHYTVKAVQLLSFTAESFAIYATLFNVNLIVTHVIKPKDYSRDALGVLVCIISNIRITYQFTFSITHFQVRYMNCPICVV